MTSSPSCYFYSYVINNSTSVDDATENEKKEKRRRRRKSPFSSLTNIQRFLAEKFWIFRKSFQLFYSALDHKIRGITVEEIEQKWSELKLA